MAVFDPPRAGSRGRAGPESIKGTSSGWTSLTPNDCDVFDLVENYFASALMERYPRAAESDYCNLGDLEALVGTGGEWQFALYTRPGECP